MEEISGIYKITNPIGQVYIGQSISFNKRKDSYRRGLAKGQPKLRYSFLKYGFEKHSIEIVEVCKIEDLSIMERKWQEYFECCTEKGLNCSLTKTKNAKGIQSIETRIKISESKKGKNSALKGYRYSEEDKDRISKIRKGYFIRDIVLNTETGIYYCSMKLAAFSKNMHVSTIRVNLKRNKQNKTPFILV